MNKTKQIIELLSTKYSFDRVDAEKYLEHVYGKNWRQPVKNFTWWKMKNINTDYE